MGDKNKSEIILDENDILYIERFFNQFQIEMPAYLVTAMHDFQKKPTLETERALKLATLLSVQEKKDQIMEIDSDVFSPIIEASVKLAYDMQFDNDLKDALADSTPLQGD